MLYMLHGVVCTAPAWWTVRGGWEHQGHIQSQTCLYTWPGACWLPGSSTACMTSFLCQLLSSSFGLQEVVLQPWEADLRSISEARKQPRKKVWRPGSSWSADSRMVCKWVGRACTGALQTDATSHGLDALRADGVIPSRPARCLLTCTRWLHVITRCMGVQRSIHSPVTYAPETPHIHMLLHQTEIRKCRSLHRQLAKSPAHRAEGQRLHRPQGMSRNSWNEPMQLSEQSSMSCVQEHVHCGTSSRGTAEQWYRHLWVACKPEAVSKQ